MADRRRAAGVAVQRTRPCSRRSGSVVSLSTSVVMAHKMTFACPCCNNPAAAARVDERVRAVGAATARRTRRRRRASTRRTWTRASTRRRISTALRTASGSTATRFRASIAWNTFTALHDANLGRLRTMLEELPAPGSGGDAIAEKVSSFWLAANDEQAVEAAGLAPLAPLLAVRDGAAARQGRGGRQGGQGMGEARALMLAATNGHAAGAHPRDIPVELPQVVHRGAAPRPSPSTRAQGRRTRTTAS